MTTPIELLASKVGLTKEQIRAIIRESVADTNAAHHDLGQARSRVDIEYASRGPLTGGGLIKRLWDGTPDEAATDVAEGTGQPVSQEPHAGVSGQLTDARVRAIVREELAARELGQQPADGLSRQAGTPLHALDPVIQGQDTGDERADQDVQDLRQLAHVITGIFQALCEPAPQPPHLAELPDDHTSRVHGGGQLVDERPRETSVVVADHDSSPSLAGLDNLSVGDRPGPAEEAGPGHTQGGAL
jgi:hypothetical protein